MRGACRNSEIQQKNNRLIRMDPYDMVSMWISLKYVHIGYIEKIRMVLVGLFKDDVSSTLLNVPSDEI